MKIAIFFLLVVSVQAFNMTLNQFDEVELMLKHCSVHPQAQHPNEGDGWNNTEITLRFDLKRLIAIDDVDQSLEFAVVFVFQWQVQCVSRLYNSDKWIDKSKQLIFRNDIDRLWSPTILHMNSLDLVSINDKFERSVTINAATGDFTLILYGRPKSYCDFDFTIFPFDS